MDEDIGTPVGDACVLDYLAWRESTRQWRLAMRHSELGEPLSHSSLRFPMWVILEGERNPQDGA